jgi:hypothetical protein
MKLQYYLYVVFACLAGFPELAAGQTAIPNSSFESWVSHGNYSDPQFWDTPNEELMAIPFFGTTVVTRSTDNHSGSYSVKLESKHITLPPLDVPGFITLGTLTLDIVNMTYSMTGGAPIGDQPTHLKGYYRYIPKGGDSCVVGIGLLKTTGGVQDTIGYGQFSTHDTVSDWQLFSAWIDYYTVSTPDTMNIFAFSTAQETVTVGTVLYLDDLFLDYTTGFNEDNPGAGINVYNDRDTKRLILFVDFPGPRPVSVALYNMLGQKIFAGSMGTVAAGRMEITYGRFTDGLYILEVNHAGKRFTCKYFLRN